MNGKELEILDKSVIQANPLIEAKKYMNVTEMRLFILGLQGVKPHISDDYGYEYDIEFKETVIPTNQLIGLLGQTYGSISNLKKQLEKAYDSKIVLNYKNGGFEFKHIYDTMKYEPEQGLVIKFDNKMKPYILEIVGQQYTKYKVKALFVLSSAYAWRILELLFTKQGYFKKGYQQVYIEYEIEQLRETLNVGKDMYKKTTDFRMYVLDRPIKEINEKTDYFVWYTTEKAGRRIKKFTIYMKLKDTNERIEAEQPPQLTSSAVIEKKTAPTSTKAETDEDVDEDVINTIDVDNLFSFPSDFDWENMPKWTPEYEKETSMTSPAPAKQEKEPAPAPAVSVAENTTTTTEPADENRTNWNEEQKADYYMLLEKKIWAEPAKKIIATYDHARIDRNFKGVMQDYPKGTIANLPAVIVKAIRDDTYRNNAEAQQELREHKEAVKKAEWEKIKNAEKKNKQQIKENEELRNIRLKYSQEKINEVLEEILRTYNENNHILTDEMVAKLRSYGLTDRHLMIFRSRKAMPHLFKSVNLYD